MTTFDLQDYDTKALVQMFEITKRKLIEKLTYKVNEIENFTPSNCCSVTMLKLDGLKRDGGVEWNQLQNIGNRLVARRKQDELLAIMHEDISSDEVKNERGRGGVMKGAGGQL